MSIPLIQKYRVAKYIIGQKLRRQKKYPLVLMLEPLFQCNLACAGCGKIDYEKDVLKQRVGVEDALNAVDECGAPVVSVAGGEPLIHKGMPEIARGIIERKKFLYLCTNAILLKKHIDEYEPSPYLTFSIHLDGDKERHDESVCQEGVYEKAVAAVKLAISKGFRVNLNCTLFNGESPPQVADFFDNVMAMGIEGVTMSPGYSYQHAPKQDVFLPRTESKQLFRDIFNLGKLRKSQWRFNQSSLFLDFLAGNQSYQCTPWANPTYNLFGWQRPCYLLVDDGYASSFKELLETTNWESYGTGRNPKCDNCMAHCGYEGTAVEDTFARPLTALKSFLFGPKTDGTMAPELPVTYAASATSYSVSVPLENIGRRSEGE